MCRAAGGSGQMATPPLPFGPFDGSITGASQPQKSWKQ